MSFSCVFFFQAEDGIRDLVRSRGLGDVYKRQPYERDSVSEQPNPFEDPALLSGVIDAMKTLDQAPVSYTHLTLPTSDLV